jgi:hypothetical protein
MMALPWIFAAISLCLVLYGYWDAYGKTAEAERAMEFEKQRADNLRRKLEIMCTYPGTTQARMIETAFKIDGNIEKAVWAGDGSKSVKNPDRVHPSQL